MTVPAIGRSVGAAAPHAKAIALPIGHNAIVETAVAALFPLLIFGTTLVQQQSDALQAVGQMFLWAAILAAVEIAMVLQGAGRAILVVVGAIMATRAANLVLGSPPPIIAAYEVANGALFALAGGAIVAWRPNVLFRQLRAFTMVCVPVMILQLYGAPSWIQAWRTDIHGEGAAGKQMVTSLFVSDPEQSYTTLQARPAGVLHANNYLSIVMLFAMAFVFGRARKDDKLTRMDIAFVLVVVLAMAKILFLSFVVFSAVYLFESGQVKRRWLRRLWLALLVSLGVYYVFFPGVFLYDLSPDNALLNYAIRVADLRAVISGASLSDVSIQGLSGATLSVAGIRAGSQSGYASLARILPVAAIVLPLAAAVFIGRLRRLRREYPERAELARNGVLVLVLAPIITSFAGNPFFAFIFGLALLPWLIPPHGELR